jgi:hypothetical protein
MWEDRDEPYPSQLCRRQSLYFNCPSVCTADDSLCVDIQSLLLDSAVVIQGNGRVQSLGSAHARMKRWYHELVRYGTVSDVNLPTAAANTCGI